MYAEYNTADSCHNPAKSRTQTEAMDTTEDAYGDQYSVSIYLFCMHNTAIVVNI